MEKLKEGRVRRRQTIDFVSPLQLEACQDRVEHGVLPTNLKIAAQHSIHDDKLQLTARLYRGQKLSIRAGITLSRWEGTKTRLQGQVEFLRGGISYKVFWLVWVFFSMIYCAIVEYVTSVLDAALSKLNPTPDFILIFSLFVLLSLYLIMFILVARLNDFFERRELMSDLKRILSDSATQEERV